MHSIAEVNRINVIAWKRLLSASDPFIFIATYKVETREKDGIKETLELFVRLTAMHVTLKFLVAFTRFGSDEDRFSIS